LLHPVVLVHVGATVFKESLHHFKSDRAKIWQDCSSKYKLIDRVRFSSWR